MKKVISMVSATLIMFAVSTPFTTAKSAEFFSIGTGGPTGVYFQTGNAICKMLHKSAIAKEHGRKKGIDKAYRCTAPSTGGSNYNIGQIAAGEFQFGVNCNSAGQQDLNINGQLEIGDFYYPGFVWRGDNDGVYEYKITTSSTSCSSSFPSFSTSYYAAEPFAKYVTQLYTDTSLITPASINSTARFRRMYERGSSAVSNPERTKDGAYTATFSQGARSSDSTPCLF